MTRSNKEERIMAFLDDFANSISGYPAASVTLTFGSLAVQSGTSGSVNVNEVWSFKVTVEVAPE